VKLWYQLIALGYHLFYNQMAWSYDAVAWLVSKGEWRRWGQTVLAWLDGHHVLEVGCGPGHLLGDMVARGYQPVGLDQSAAMVRQASRKLARRDLYVPLVRGRAEALPFRDGSFDSVVMTFPAAFVVAAATRHEVWRILKRDGRWLAVDFARLTGGGLWARAVNLAFRLTSVHLPLALLQALLEGGPLPEGTSELAGRKIEPGDPEIRFRLTWHDEPTAYAVVRVLIATKVLPGHDRL
jgi:SAM-dependent methyltransferase